MKKKDRQLVYDKYDGKCAYTGVALGDDWQVDHVTSRFEYSFKLQGNADSIDNLLPSMRIVNHYKRSKNLEQFREYMLSFHHRLAKLPKKTSLESTERRIKYMNEIATLFDITIDRPFDGIFYFERI